MLIDALSAGFCSYLPAKGMTRLLQTITRMYRQINPKPAITVCLLTMVKCLMERERWLDIGKLILYLEINFRCDSVEIC